MLWRGLKSTAALCLDNDMSLAYFKISQFRIPFALFSHRCQNSFVLFHFCMCVFAFFYINI